MSGAAPLPAFARAGRLAAAYALLLAAGPGALAQGGVWWLAALGAGLWALAAVRPGPRAFRVEWLFGTLYFGAVVWWIAHVYWVGLVPTAVGCGLYAAFTGALARRLAPLGAILAPALAWTSLETLRDVLHPPLGFGWVRVAHSAVDAPFLLGGARVLGGVGLTLALVALGAWVWRLAAARGRLRPAAHAAGLAPLAVVALCGALTAPPATVPGPRLLLVQPNVPQARKQSPGARDVIFLDQVAVTRAGLDAVPADAPVDVVCWAETMLPIPLFAPDLEAAIARGARLEPWREDDGLEALLAWRPAERLWVHELLLGLGASRGVLPEGAAFLAGAEEWVSEGDRIVRTNAVALWHPDGSRTTAAKVHLVPSAESMLGLEQYAWVRALILPLAGYVPDLEPADEIGVLELPGRDGGPWRAAVQVCFDNAYVGAFVDPVARERVDLHLVSSNEAWYLESWEQDQLLAAARLYAACSGRSVARVTNSGTSALVGPDGALLEQLAVDGRTRQVGGTLLVRPPVPDRAGLPPQAHAPRPPFVLLAGPLRTAAALLGPLAALVLWLRRRRAADSAHSADADGDPAAAER